MSCMVLYMNTKQIARTEQADTITYQVIIDGTDAAELVIDAATRKVCNIETRAAFARQGLATELWTAANAEAECFHAVDHHRTEAGDAFAQAVGGETIDAADDYTPTCYICTSCDDDDDTYGY